MILAQWVVNVGRRDAKARLAHLLCEMAFRYKAPRQGAQVQFRLPMTQDQLADAAGLTPVHVNRTLKALEPIGVQFRHKMVRILDWERLAEVGDFDSGYLQADITPEERIRIIPRVG